jgi:alkylhydroperoxidase family enzyme
MVQLNNVVMSDPSGHLDQGLKRRIGAYCSRLNGCTYCTAHNCGTLKTAIDTDAEGWGFSDDDISELLDDNYVPDAAAEKACFEYARAASTDSSNVPREILDALAEHLTPPQVVELVCLVGFWKMYNTIHDSLHVPLEQNLLAESGWVDR